MTTDAQLDKIVEDARADDVDAAFGGDETPEDVVPYTAETWHDACADYLRSDNAKTNDEIREKLRQAMQNMQYITQDLSSDSLRLMATRGVANAATCIGFAIISNAIANGLTLENVGDYSDV